MNDIRQPAGEKIPVAEFARIPLPEVWRLPLPLARSLIPAGCIQKRHSRMAAVVLLLAAVAGLGKLMSGWEDRAQAAQPRGKTPAAASEKSILARSVSEEFALQGAASCAAGACHGGVHRGDDNRWNSSYTTWILEDPHARAYQALFSAKSRAMAERLGPEVLRAENAHTSPVCLPCHSSQAEARHATVPEEILADGVSCESCHGVATNWAHSHYLASWKNLSAKQKSELGFRDLRHLNERVKACAACHVGAKDREVNHDLIAAGHPRLSFEFSAFMSKMPGHWNIAQARQRFTERQAWSVGQTESALAALELLEDRARSARDLKELPAPGLPPRVWPEFAEYDCFACHHELPDPSADAVRQSGALPGTYAWGTWYLTGLRWPAADPLPAVDALQRELARPAPRPERVLTLAESVRGQLKPVQVRALGGELLPSWDEFARIAEAGPDKAPFKSWDEAAQFYLALVSRYEADREAGFKKTGNVKWSDPPLEEQLLTLRLKLAFTPAEKTTGTKPGTLYDGPRDFQPRQFVEDLQPLLKLLRQRQIQPAVPDRRN